MPRYRVLKSKVWKGYKEGDLVDTPKILDFYVKEGVVEEVVVKLQVDDVHVVTQARVKRDS